MPMGGITPEPKRAGDLLNRNKYLVPHFPEYSLTGRLNNCVQ
jgi:hypothetical protein